MHRNLGISEENQEKMAKAIAAGFAAQLEAKLAADYEAQLAEQRMWWEEERRWESEECSADAVTFDCKQVVMVEAHR